MFKPSSLISTPCTPTLFDFRTIQKEEIMEFTIPIDFISHQTALCHGVSSPQSSRAKLIESLHHGLTLISSLEEVSTPKRTQQH
jgi:hypothetical protein